MLPTALGNTSPAPARIHFLEAAAALRKGATYVRDRTSYGAPAAPAKSKQARASSCVLDRASHAPHGHAHLLAATESTNPPDPSHRGAIIPKRNGRAI